MNKRVHAAISSILTLASTAALASSHREAPFVAEHPKVDGTDLYMFMSYEAGRAGYVTIIANYDPLQDAYGGPNYFALDPNALYEINIDNSGDSVEDLTFQFRFTNNYGQANIAALGVAGGKVPVAGGPAGGVEVPLINIGGGTGAMTGALNQTESYTLTLVRGGRRIGTATPVTATDGKTTTFTKPVDNIGTKSIPNYAGYAAQYIYPINVPGCTVAGAPATGRVFVGQRQEGFVVNLGAIFDQIDLNPLGPRNSTANVIGGKNITSLALEIPAACLTAGSDPVIGAWTTASMRQSRILNPAPTGPTTTASTKGPEVTGGPWAQVSRLGSPLVNEVVIGLTDKDKYNASQPANDVANFGTYVLYPTLPVLVNVLFSVPPPATPRNDLLAAFVTGITATVNGAPFKYTAPANQTVGGEMLRLNTAIAATPVATQQDLGFLACDLAGFPNGRRPIDDVVDIELTVVEGALTGTNNLQTCNPAGATPVVMNAGAVVNDGAEPNPAAYLTTFPYLNTPLPGATAAP
jgi:hypothetical protein